MAALLEASIDRFAFKGEDGKHALVHTAKRFLAKETDHLSATAHPREGCQ